MLFDVIVVRSLSERFRIAKNLECLELFAVIDDYLDQHTDLTIDDIVVIPKYRG